MRKIEHDSVAAEYRKRISTYAKPWFKSCSKFLEEKKINGQKCLDLCAGNCEFSTILRDNFRMEVTCADYVPLHLAQARQNGFATISIDIDAVDSEVDLIAENYREQFDIVFSLATIEHVFNSDNLLRFTHTVLKPSGIFVVNTPNISFFGYRLFSLFSGNRPFGEGHHVRFWDYRFLRTNLYLNGFQVRHDRREFYTLPEDTLNRALRGKKSLAKLFALCFMPCRLFQHIPFMRGLVCDELTLVCEKEQTVPLGFDYLKTKLKLESNLEEQDKCQMVELLITAYQKGWLKEHLYLEKLARNYLVKKES